jgi:hypothetical protein
MDNEERNSIADNQRSPASEAADEVEFGPAGTNPEDEERTEPPGGTEATEPKTGPEGEPSVPPSRASHT